MADIIVTNQGHKIQVAVKVQAASVRVPYKFTRVSAALAFIGILIHSQGTPTHLTCDQYFFKCRQGEAKHDKADNSGSKKIREAGPDQV